MIKVLHIIDFLCLGGAARSMIAISKYSFRLDEQLQHQVISLKEADRSAVESAELAGMKFIAPVDDIARNQLISEADIVHVHYWNNPQIFSFLHSELPPARLIIWFHVSGDSAPQVITRDLINYADFAIPCNPHSYDLPVVRQLAPEIRQKKVGMVYDAADFERVKNIQPKQHDTFNVGYIGALAFSKMHPNYIDMSAKANIPNVRFILCGGGDINLLQQQASDLEASSKFDFRGFVEDISSVIAEFDVYGYPLCEDTYAAAELNLQEVMYAGIPPIVFPYGGIKKLVIDNYTGLVVNSELEYSQALEYLYHNSQERIRLGKNAKQYAEQIFGAENAAKQLNPIYHQLMETPKRIRQWSIPVDGSLLDEPVTLLDIVDISPQLEGAKTFIESIGDTASQFINSLTSEDINQLFAADEKIANSSTLLGLGEGGVLQYLHHYPQDAYLRLWVALICKSQGKTLDAMKLFIDAINCGCNHWRVFWYLAQVVEDLQETSVLQEALNTLSSIVPDFAPAQEMRARLQKLLDSEFDLSSLNLREINYIIFPDLHQSDEELGLELQTVIQTLANHPNKEKVTLIIHTSNIAIEEAEIFLSSVAMNLLMEDLDITDTINISLIDKLGNMQWQSLLPHIYARIILNHEDEVALAQAPVSKIQSYQIDRLINQQFSYM
ncbi:MAG: glycosyltransferase family 4 protein [Aulosira sp. DedQUE10]|nr:glycosyltransferase family 4 protein [Aulosira sp. DedQUE10]